MENTELINERRSFLNSKLSKGHTVGVVWVAEKKGLSRACISLKNYRSTGNNTVAHISKYYTRWCRNRRRFTNINLLTLKEVHADGEVFLF